MSEEDKLKQAAAAEQKSAIKYTFTKGAIETEQRIEAAGTDGDLPLPKQAQEAVDEANELEEQIEGLKKWGARTLPT